MGKFKLNPAQERRLVIDRSDGYTARQLVDKYGVSESTVYRILADYNVQRSIGNKQKKRRPLRKERQTPRELKPCGTNAAYARHKYKGEYPCALCLEAHAKQQKEYHASKTQAASGTGNKRA